MADNKAGKFALSAVLAAVAGYVAGVLTAPKEGAKTREELKDKAAVWQKDVEKELGDLQKQLADVVDKAKRNGDSLSSQAQEKLAPAVEQAKVAKDKIVSVVGSRKDGKASDKDLQKALDEAKKSLDQLKKFMDK